jgi:hypothetical protein
LTTPDALAKLEELTLRQGAIPIIYFDECKYHVEVPFSNYQGSGYTLAEAIDDARQQ